MKTTEPLTPEAARKKELHYRSMVWTGAFMTACGLAALYLAMSSGPVPALFFGRLRSSAAPAQGHSRRAEASLVSWRGWDAAALQEARASGKLVLLDVCVSYNRACAVMDETTYADRGVADAVAKSFVAVRVDADERPDIAARYQAGGWPSTLLLSPDGRPLGRATFLTPELFLPWATSIDQAWQARKGKPVPEPEVSEEAAPSADPQAELADAWDDPGARFPRFDRIVLLKQLSGLSWASALAAHAAQSVLALEDPGWGGFFRCADGPGWENPETEKRLADQAGAILAGVEVEKTFAYVDRFLSAPGGGYFSSQSCELRLGQDVVEGRYFYSLKARPGAPAVDRRVFVDSNAAMIRAALSSGDAVQKRRASQTLDLIWRGARKGVVPHQLTGGPVSGLLLDEASLGRALAQSREWSRAREVADAMDRTLLDKSSGAYFDRPATGELPPALDRLLLPSQNFQAFLFLRELPGRDTRALKGWLTSNAARLDPAARAALSVLP